MTRAATFGHAATLASIALMVLALLPRVVVAQERPGPVAEFSAGWIGFPDDAEIVSEGSFIGFRFGQ